MPVDVATLSAPLTELAATFTTLRIDGDLRGCCGILEAVRPLATDVAHSAFQAAFRDIRFKPVRDVELDAIRLEVSVLSTPEPMAFADQADLLEQLVPGEDGLIIVAHGRRATLLPKVWEQVPDPQKFVGALKMKCGLSRNYWSDDLGFLRYTTTTYAD